MQELRNYWSKLSQRERVTLLLGGIGTALILGYAFLWQPWQQALERLRVQVPTKQATLLWMEKEAKNFSPSDVKAAATKRNQKPILTVLEQTAEQAKLRGSIRRMQPAENNQVKIWLSDADFDPWLQWLDKLSRSGIEVLTSNISRAGPNKVNIRLTVYRPS